MNIITLKRAIIAVIAVALLFASYRMGYSAADAKWQRQEADRKDIELASIQEELQALEILKGRYEQEKQLLKKGHADELAKSRALSAAAPGLRISAAVCGEFSAKTQANGAGGSGSGDTATRLVPERVDQDFRALEMKIEQIFAGCRVGQRFLAENGMLP